MSALFAASKSSTLAMRAIAGSMRISSSLQFARFYAASDFPPHTIINMPALSPTMTQGNIGSWAKKAGDELSPGEAIAEIETDKASMDFEFQEEGFLAKILMDAGSKDVPVGKPIAVYVEEAEDVAKFEGFTLADVAGGAAPAATPVAEKAAPAETSAPAATPAPAAAAAAPAKKAPTDRIIASPFAKTLALEKGISLKGIQGSGPGGRIVAKDIENIQPTAATPAAGGAIAAAPAGASYEDIPITAMRSTIASRLLQSTTQSPTYIVQSQISVSKLLKLRASLNATADDRYRLSINDLLVKAIARTCVRVPEVNSSWLGDEGVIRQYNNVDVSVAVSTPTGLITPIVKDAHIKGLAEISNEIKDLGKRAKIGKLNPEEYIGGTVCISNLGMNPAVNTFTSIINPPQSAIFAIGTTEKKAVPSSVNEQGFVFDDVITITGTFDHRVIDGAKGGDWIRELKKIIENPLELLV
ncbi:Dihydrolipoyllysine-residue acetyltransferase [Spathaspora sp. JA1]|nr:Dihydrolipoyllysine-residue acetyltransferase [Spathaspora sp. JA1]